MARLSRFTRWGSVAATAKENARVQNRDVWIELISETVKFAHGAPRRPVHNRVEGYRWRRPTEGGSVVIVEGFEPFVGKHAGLDLSEPMLFGLAQGLGFIYSDTKGMGFSFMGDRIKQNLLTDNIVKNLGPRLDRKETSSVKKAWENVRASIDAGVPVGLQLDSYYLDYFTNKFHFGAHYVARYGYDDSHAYLVEPPSRVAA